MEKCGYIMQQRAADDFDVCGDPIGLCIDGLCDYHCEKYCVCGGWQLTMEVEDLEQELPLSKLVDNPKTNLVDGCFVHGWETNPSCHDCALVKGGNL